MILSIVLGLSLGCPRDWKLVIGWLGVRWGLIPYVLLVPLTGELFFLPLFFILILENEDVEGRRVKDQKLMSDSKDPQCHGLQAATPTTP